VFINIDLRHEAFLGYIQDLSARDPLSIINGFGILPWTGQPEWLPALLWIGPLAILYGASMSLMYMLQPALLSFGQQYWITRKNGVDTPIDKFFRKITGKPEPIAEGAAVEVEPNSVKKKKKPKSKK